MYKTKYYGGIIAKEDWCAEVINLAEKIIAKQIVELPFWKKIKETYFDTNIPNTINEAFEIFGKTYGFSWESMEQDMEYISSQNPGIVIVIEGFGDSREDMWKEYFKDGKHLFNGAKISWKWLNIDEWKLVDETELK